MNVKIIYVYEKMIFVTELMIVMMGQMKMRKFAVSYAIFLNSRMTKDKRCEVKIISIIFVFVF